MYATVAEFRGSGSMPVIAQATASAIPDEEVESLLLKASRLFDLICGVDEGYFEAAGQAATNRTFYGDGTHYLKIDPYVSGSLNTTITLPDGYTAPEFVERQGYLVISNSGTLSSRLAPFPCSGGWFAGVPVTISARWGLAAIPEPVKQVVIKWAAELWRITDPANQKLLAIEGQPISPQRIPPFAEQVAKRYRSNLGVLV